LPYDQSWQVRAEQEVLATGNDAEYLALRICPAYSWAYLGNAEQYIGEVHVLDHPRSANEQKTAESFERLAKQLLYSSGILG
jgi:hypothetical protein